jgi:hypothetical protein
LIRQVFGSNGCGYRLQILRRLSRATANLKFQLELVDAGQLESARLAALLQHCAPMQHGAAGLYVALVGPTRKQALTESQAPLPDCRV